MVFNVQGSEFLFLLVVALIVLGPEKLPDAIRKFGRAYSEFKKMANGFQGEIRSVLDEPMRELRDTADAMRSAANFDLGGIVSGTATDPVATSTQAPAPIEREPGLNFGSANPRRSKADDAVPEEPARAPGLNFGSATPRRTRQPEVPDDDTPSNDTPSNDTPSDDSGELPG